MSLRNRVIVISMLVGLGVIALLVPLVSWLSGRVFLQIETELMTKNIVRLQNHLNGVENDLRSTTRDWAYWDETYEFLAGENKDYPTRNLKAEDLATIQVWFIMLFDREGNPVLERAVDADRVEVAPPPAAIFDAIRSDHSLTNPENVLDGKSGVIKNGDVSYFVSAYPVYDSNREHPSSGTLIFGRMFDEAELQKIGETLDLQIDREEYGAEALPKDYQIAKSALTRDGAPYLVREVDQHLLGGYLIINDLHGQPVWLLRIGDGRELNQRRISALFSIILLLVLAALVIIFLTYFLVERLVTGRLEMLNDEVGKIGVDPQGIKWVSVVGSDEIASLAGRVNEMITRMTLMQGELRRQNLELEKSNDQNRAAAEALAQASRARDEFFNMMSHELRSPLSAIIGLSEALQDHTFGALNQEQSDMLGVVMMEGNHLLKTIDRILDYMKVETGKLALEMNWTAIYTICEKSLEPLKSRADSRNIRILCSMEDPHGRIWVDEEQICRVLVILLENAVAFSKEGEEVGLLVHGMPGEDSVCFEVWDHGIGIAKEDQETIFKPFNQLDSGMRRSRGGTGLGLAFASSLVMHMGGTIRVESAPGAGSRFFVHLPGLPAEQGSLQINPFSFAE